MNHQIILQLLKFKSILEPQGKLIVSVTNFRYSFILKLLEKIGVKKKSPKLSQIHENHIKNLAQTAGLEFVTSYTKQIVPFIWGAFFIKFSTRIDV